MVARLTRMGMAARLLAAFALLIMMLVVFSVWAYRRALDERRDASLQETVQSAQTVAALINGLLSDFDGTTLAMSSALANQTRPINQETVGPYLAAVQSRYPYVRAFFVTDPAGVVLASGNGDGVGMDVSSRPYIQALRGGQEYVLSDVLAGTQSGTPTVSFARVIRTQDGAVRGHVVVVFYPDRLTDLLPGGLAPGASFKVYDSRGWLVYSSAAPELPFQQRDTSSINQVHLALAGEVVREPSLPSVINGQEQLAVFAPVAEYGWAVGSFRTHAAVEAPLQSVYRGQLVSLAVVAAFALLLALLFSRAFAQPLSRLAAQARVLGGGGRPAPVRPSGPAEVRTLASTFNQMAADLDRRASEREAALAALAAAEARYRGIFEHALEAIVQIDTAGRFHALNPAAARLLGYATPAEVIASVQDGGQLWLDPARLREALRMLREQGEVSNYEFEVRRRDGSAVWVSMNAWASRNGDGRIEIIEAMLSDISERKRAEQEREHLLEREQAARAAAEAAELRLSALVQNAADIILVVDAEAKVRYASPAVTRVLGWEPEAYPDADIFSFIHPDDVPRVQQSFAGVLRAPGVHNWIEFRVRHADGSWRTVEGASNVRFNDPGVNGIVVNIRDITDRKRAEDAVRASRDELAFLAEASDVLGASLDYEATLATVAQLVVPRLADWCGVDLLDDNGDVRRLAVAHVDPAKVRLAQELQQRYPPDRDARQGLYQVIRTGKSEIFPHFSDEMLVAGARDAEHLRILRSIGMSSGMIVPLTANGRALGAIFFVAAESGRRYDAGDLTLAEELARRCALAIDRARVYRAELQARQAAESANRAKDEFLSVLSHELRTPLTPILGFTGLLRRRVNLDPAMLNSALDTIERSAKVQARLVNDLLDVSRIITGKLELELQPIDPESVVRAAVDAAGHDATTARVNLSADIAPAPGLVSGDAVRLQQVIANLLTNAIKFTPAGGSVRVIMQPAGDAVEIAVADTGIGIDPDFLPYVFERFRQADGSSTRAHGGLGLGLAIVSHLVEAHGGQVTATSPGLGQGATFTIRLPLLSAATTAGAPSGSIPGEATGGGLLAGTRVLVVDDDDATRGFLEALLEEEGATVRQAASTAEGLAALDAGLPDILLVDIGMPGEDGYSFIEKLRARPEHAGGRLPAIALTAFAGTADRRRALAAGFDQHLPKPVDAQTLLSTLVRLAGRPRGQPQLSG